ncbi:ABC-F family ATP-binding cassette domain-containing protein [Myxococcota bacterium]|nr:ABC-F family ATP-binding cassette domain-containing protein [Myxococcota bacterium]MBU1382548.1 ABC-F family ATP-binding cassette domain-containing protein [Myxococcota bacterium]MBU1497440.1 ABC-F family ATP-binding cassette domain-containing protein [Myxococcota bacterium]
MSLLNLVNINLSFGSREIFTNLSLQISSGDKIGLIGANGRGKTTLFRIIRGELKPDSGEVSFLKGARIGYLPQEMDFTSDDTIISYLMSANTKADDIQEEIVRLEEELHNEDAPDALEAIAAQLGALHEELHSKDSQYSQHEAEMILCGLGFSVADLSRKVSEFSGGWKMRILLASLLFSKPDLLLMDEPTNHLDLPSLVWLDQFLATYRKTMVLISHDRDFLDRHVSRVFALEPEGFRAYRGNYSQSRLLREEEEKIIENRRKNVDRERKQLENFIERFKAQANKARQAKSKAKILKRLENVEEIESDDHFLFHFPKSDRSGDRTLVLDSIAKGFGDNILYSNVNQTIMRGRRIGLVGVNGSGKTTLLRILAGELTPDEGRVIIGSNVKISYYAQHQTQALDPALSIVDEVRRWAPSLGETAVRNILGCFLFRGDDADKLVKVLSGGEKARVALARLLVNPGNFLMMDEPTNHLDIESSEALLDALLEYDGTVLFVSHNRGFLDRLANEIWEIDDNRLIVFQGNFSEYIEHLKDRNQLRLFLPSDRNSLSESRPASIGSVEKKKDSKTDKRRKEAKFREILTRELGPVKSKIESLEKRISEIEVRQEILEKQLADTEMYAKPEYPGLIKEFSENKEKLEDLMARWSFQSELYETKKIELEARRDD